jgi:hypothetical protein
MMLSLKGKTAGYSKEKGSDIINEDNYLERIRR